MLKYILATQPSMNESLAYTIIVVTAIALILLILSNRESSQEKLLKKWRKVKKHTL